MSAPAFGLAQDDSAVRARALDPAGSFIVQAPAGSGKTSLLVQRFLVLLGRVEQPEAIAAITFTRKAAAEMRARIVEALARAAAGETGSSRHEQTTLEAAQAALQRDREAGWDLRSNPARLRIQTIDSLCASIVQRMPWMARTGGMPAIAEDARELYREAARHTLGHLTGPGRAGQAVERLLLHLDNHYRSLAAMFEDLLPKRDQWLRHLGVGAGVGAEGEALRAALEDSLAGVVKQGLERAAHRIPPLVLARIVELHDAAAARLDPARPRVQVAPGTAAADLPGWRALADFLLTGNDHWRKSADSRHGFPPHYKEEKREFLEIAGTLAEDEALLAALVEIRKLPDARFREEQWSVLESLLTLLPVAAAELKLTFRERGTVDFVELGEAARRALGSTGHPTDLAFSLGERIEHLLVDEFQDTSVSQFELVERLVAGWEAADPGDRTLFLVGDPMQSIYRFREAQVGLFLRARTAGVGAVSCEPLQLTANFRSRPGIVDWVNTAFTSIFPAAEDAALGAIAYSASQPRRAVAASAEVTIHAYFNSAEQEEAAEVARLAEAALPGSVAVLVRARSHAIAIVAEFERRRIPFRAVEFDPLAERPAMQDLQALTRAMLHPGDRAAWLAILRAPWCGLTLAELHDLAADPRAMMWDRLTRSASPRLQRVREALAEPLALVRRIPLRQCVEPAWIRLGGPACLTSAADRADCVRYFDLLEEIDNGGETTFDLLERRLGQLFGLPPPVDGPAVELMTIHKAKGLEWDTVIVPGLGREAAADAKPLLRWSEVPGPDGSTSLVFAPIEATREENDDAIFSYLARMERQRSRYETARLLYVAATRARERLHWLGHAEVNAKGEAKPRSGTLLQLLWPAVERHFAAAMPPGATKGAAATETLPLDQRMRRLPESWQPPKPAARPEWEPRETGETEVTFDWTGDTLRHAGAVTHVWLDRIAREGLGRWTVTRVREEVTLFREALEALGLADDAEIAVGAAAVEAALTRSLADPRGRWLLGPHPEAANELRVSVFDGGTVHNGVIDRTFVDTEGVRWIIDYKTSSHEGADAAAFLDNELQRYRARLERYARYFRATESRPIRLGLYFPLMGGWRQWQPE